MLKKDVSQQPEAQAAENTEAQTENGHRPFTKDDLIINVIQTNPNTIRAMMRVGMGCVTCPASLMETVEQAAMVHGIDPNMLVDLINQEPAYVASEGQA